MSEEGLAGLFAHCRRMLRFGVFKRTLMSRSLFISRTMCSLEAVPAEPLYTLIDIGANLTNKSFNNRDLESVLERSRIAGLKKIMVTGTSVENSKEALRLAKLYPDYLYSTAGIHPHDAKHFNNESVEALTLLASNAECVAIGECGLDFNRNFSPQEDQLAAFESQVDLACRLKKPLFIHEREASCALLKILSKFESDLPPVVIHCFTGTIDEAKMYTEKGFYIGLTGFLWKDKLENGVQEALRTNAIPLDRLLLETDSPFMFPNVRAKKIPDVIQRKISERSKLFLFRYCSFQRNEPCALPAIAELIAAYMNLPAHEVALRTTYNALKVFGLSG